MASEKEILEGGYNPPPPGGVKPPPQVPPAPPMDRYQALMNKERARRAKCIASSKSMLPVGDQATVLALAQELRALTTAIGNLTAVVRNRQ